MRNHFQVLKWSFFIQEGEAFLESSGKPDETARTRGEQEQIDEALAASEIPAIPRDNTMQVTAKVGKIRATKLQSFILGQSQNICLSSIYFIQKLTNILLRPFKNISDTRTNRKNHSLIIDSHINRFSFLMK